MSVKRYCKLQKYEDVPLCTKDLCAKYKARNKRAGICYYSERYPSFNTDEEERQVLNDRYYAKEEWE